MPHPSPFSLRLTDESYQSLRSPYFFSPNVVVRLPLDPWTLLISVLHSPHPPRTSYGLATYTSPSSPHITHATPPPPPPPHTDPTKIVSPFLSPPLSINPPPPPPHCFFFFFFAVLRHSIFPQREICEVPPSLIEIPPSLVPRISSQVV